MVRCDGVGGEQGGVRGKVSSIVTVSSLCDRR